MSTIHVEAGSSQIFLVYHPDHRVQFHQQLCHLGSQNGCAVKLSPVLILEPQNTDDVNVSDAEDVRGRCQRLPTTNRRLSRTQEAVVPPETTGRRSMTSEPAPTAFMKSFCAPQLEAHVNALLFACTTGGSTACRAQLAELPEFPADDSLSNLPREFEDAVRMLIYDRVTSDAALQVRQDLADTMLYPAVLLHASAAAEGLPVVFNIDVFHTILNSVLHKSSHVKMGRWESKSRHWWVGTANVGEGKSPGMKVLEQIACPSVLQLLHRCNTRTEETFTTITVHSGNNYECR